MQVAGRRSHAARRWSMLTQSGVVAGSLVSVERGEAPRDDRPRVRVGGRFAGEVPGVELGDGGVEVVEVEHDDRHDPLVGVDLDDVEDLGVERLGPLVALEYRARLRTRCSPRVAMTVDVTSVTPRSAIAAHLCDHGIPTVSDARVYHSTAIVAGNVVGQHLGHRVPVAGREVRPDALVHSACRVFQPRCRSAELIEPRERGVEVCLVEDLAAVDQVAFDRRKRRSRATRRRSLLARSHAPTWVTTAPRSFSRCTASM